MRWGIWAGVGFLLVLLFVVIRFLAWAGDQDHLAPGYFGAEDDIDGEN